MKGNAAVSRAFDETATWVPSSPSSSGSPHEWVNAVRSWQPPSDIQSKEQPVDFAVDGLIPARKVGALVAAGGTGKTTLQITLGVSIAIKRRFMGCEVQQGSFVLLSSDDSQEDLDGALARVVRAIKLTDAELELVKRKVRVHSLQGLGGDKTFAAMVNSGPASTGLETLIVEALRGIDDLRVLGLDTLRQFSGGSSNDEQIIKLTIAGATEVARLTGCAVVVSHHTGKTNYRDGITDMYCGSGSAAIADNCRFVLLLQNTTWSDIESKVQRTGREAGEPLVLQSTRGSLLVKAQPPIYLHRDGFYIGRVAGASLSYDQVLDKRDRAVLLAVRSGAQSKNAIAARVGGNKTAVLACVDDLEARGYIRNGSVSRPQFILTTEGARFLEASE